MAVRIAYDDRAVQDALNRLRDRVDDLQPAMREIAGHLKDSVDEAFASESAPDGSAWEPLAESTIADRLRNRYRAGPVLERSGDLAGRILADWDDESAVVGSNQTFGGDVLAAAVHHFGTRDGRVSRPAVLRRVRRGPGGHHSGRAGSPRGAAQQLAPHCSISWKFSRPVFASL